MTVLAIDTSSRRRIVCVLASREGELVRGIVEDDVDLDRALPPALQSLLGDEVAGVAVVIGPGSYTGVRTGMAAGLGLAQARDAPLYGIPSLVPVWLAARALGSQAGWAVANAGRGAVYAMPFSRETAGVTMSAAWSRIELDVFDTQGLPVYSADGLPLDGVHRVDPALALALAVPQALCLPLRLDGLGAVYDGPG